MTSRLNSSRPSGRPPSLGETSALLNDADARMQQLLAAFPDNDPDDDLDEHMDDPVIDMHAEGAKIARQMRIPPNYRPPDNDDDLVEDDLNDDDYDIDMHETGQQMAQSLGIATSTQSSPNLDGMDLDLDIDITSSLPDTRQPVPPREFTENDEFEEEDESDSTEESTDSSSTTVKLKQYAVAILILVVVVIGVVIFMNLSNKSEQTVIQQPTDNQSTAAPVTNKFKIDTVKQGTSNIWQDSMVIDKYIELDKEACLFVFEGYAENARAFIKAYVDLNTYNTYKTGARVSVTYEYVELQNTRYYINVEVI